MKLDKIACDWNGCKEALETVQGQPIDSEWLSLQITNLHTNKTATLFLCPVHGRMWEGTDMRSLDTVLEPLEVL